MAKAKKNKIIFRHHRIWTADLGCSLRTLGTYPCCRLSQNFYRTYLLKIHLYRIWKEIQGTCRRRLWLWRRFRCIRSRQHFLCSARGTLEWNCKGSPHTGNRHNLRQSHDSHRSRQQKPQRSPSKKLRQPPNWTNASLVT